MLAKGNSKLGKTIWQWSIPAGHTCPGKSDTCTRRCYAQKGFFNMPALKASLLRNLERTELDDFVDDMVEDIHKKKARTVRIHVAGDMYSIAYVKKWHDIVRRCPDTRFFMYTRSWRLADYRAALTDMAECDNLRMWWSADVETGYPESVPAKIRVCYMQLTPDDTPDERCNLVFRDYPMRDTVGKSSNGVLVCPAENGATKITCEKCQLCFGKSGDQLHQKKLESPRMATKANANKMSLPIVR